MNTFCPAEWDLNYSESLHRMMGKNTQFLF
jgi:hypothetical protein